MATNTITGKLLRYYATYNFWVTSCYIDCYRFDTSLSRHEIFHFVKVEMSVDSSTFHDSHRIGFDLYIQRLKRKHYELEHPLEDPEKKIKERPQLYTEPLPLNTDVNVFQYVFGSSCSLDFFGSRYVDHTLIIKTMRCGITWEEARFLIEKKHGLFDVKQRKANLVGSYIQGFLWDSNMKNWRKEAKLIPKDRIMQYTDQVIVILKPIPHGLSAYVPEKYRPEVEVMQRDLMTDSEKKREEDIHKFIDYLKSSTKIKETMTEDEKIGAIMDQMDSQLSLDQLKEKLLQKNRRSKNIQQFHPSDMESNPTMIKPPPDHYVCHRCGKRGHWKNMCKTLTDANFVPVTQTRVPTGIPKTLLREATTDEERKSAMIADDGKLVVMITNVSIPKIASIMPSVSEPDQENADDEYEYYYE